jgi:hypothetical protein
MRGLWPTRVCYAIRKNQTWRMRWRGRVACVGEKRNTYRFLVRKPEGKKSLGRPSHRWEDNIEMCLKEVG